MTNTSVSDMHLHFMSFLYISHNFTLHIQHIVLKTIPVIIITESSPHNTSLLPGIPPKFGDTWPRNILSGHIFSLTIPRHGCWFVTSLYACDITLFGVIRKFTGLQSSSLCYIPLTPLPSPIKWMHAISIHVTYFDFLAKWCSYSLKYLAFFAILTYFLLSFFKPFYVECCLYMFFITSLSFYHSK